MTDSSPGTPEIIDLRRRLEALEGAAAASKPRRVPIPDTSRFYAETIARWTVCSPTNVPAVSAQWVTYDIDATAGDEGEALTTLFDRVLSAIGGEHVMLIVRLPLTVTLRDGKYLARIRLSRARYPF